LLLEDVRAVSFTRRREALEAAGRRRPASHLRAAALVTIDSLKLLSARMLIPYLVVRARAGRTA
jgi:hypothetical protein